jgi:prolyl oligopeptidase
VTPEVAAWTDEQNAYTRSVVDNLPGRKALEDRLRPLMEVGAVTAPYVKGQRYFFSRREGIQNQPVVYWRQGYRGPTKCSSIRRSRIDWPTTVDGLAVADGRACFRTYRAGDENTTLHTLDVDTGERLPLEIPNKTQPAQWLPDGSGFVYQNLRDPKDPYTGQVMFHRIGTDPSTDLEIIRQFTKAENEKLSTTWGPFGSLSRDGKWLLVGYWVDTKSNDLWLVNFDDVRGPEGLAQGRPRGRDGCAGTVIGDTLYLHTTRRAVRWPRRWPRQTRHWRMSFRNALTPSRERVVARDVAVSYLENASNVVETFDLAGASLGRVKQPGIGSTGIATEEDRSEAYLTFTSFNYPTTIFRVDVAKPTAEPELWEQPAVPVDPTTVEVEQVWYPRKTARISMFLVHKKGWRNGRTPTLLTGYGDSTSAKPRVLGDPVPVVRRRRDPRRAEPAWRR